MAGDPLQHVGRALRHTCVVVPQEFDQAAGKAGPGPDQRNKLRDTAQRQAVFALGEKRAKVGRAVHGFLCGVIIVILFALIAATA